MLIINSNERTKRILPTYGFFQTKGKINVLKMMVSKKTQEKSLFLELSLGNGL